MILKDFRCRVAAQHMDAFSAEQARWGELRSEAGFVGQCGGVDAGDRSMVQIFGMWDGLDSYRRFMSGAHDRIFEAGRQGECYTDSESTVYERVLDMPGVEGDLVGALGHGAAMIRVARCDVLADRVEHFVDVQRTVWREGMREAPGMFGGNFWRSVDAECRFIVTTAWASVDDHERYRSERLDGLLAQAGDDLVSIEGSAIELRAVWTVLG